MDPLPPGFVNRMTEILGSRDALDGLLAARSRQAVRVNTLKATVPQTRRRLAALGVQTQPVPFAPDALFVHDPQGRALGATWEHQSGQFFGQDAASGLAVLALDPRPDEAVLDLCAAPGGKAGHIAALMRNTGLLVANETVQGRLNNLVSNLDRVGALNAVVTRADGCRSAWPVTFDRVLVDAPCSNLGSIHATWGPVLRYDRASTPSFVGTQRGLLETAFHACRPDGVIVYSTCTIEPDENEGVVSWFLERYPVAIERPPVDVKAEAWTHAAGARYRDDVAGALRLHAGEVGTDGFFLARFRKLADEAPAASLRPLPRRRSMLRPEPPGTAARLAQGFVLDAPALEGAHATAATRRSYVSTVPELGAAVALGPERIGLYFGSREDDGVRMAFDAVTLLGRGAGRTVGLSPADARRWIAGEAVAAPRTAEWSVVACGEEPLGCGRSFGAAMPSFVPRHRRVPADGELVGFLAA